MGKCVLLVAVVLGMTDIIESLITQKSAITKWCDVAGEHVSGW